MTGKRKRSRPQHTLAGGPKRQKVSGPSQASKDPVVKQALLAQYYPHVFTLREYLIQRLPSTSKLRRKKIVSIGRRPAPQEPEQERDLSRFLDGTLVGVSVCTDVSREERWKHWTTFSQRADESASTLVNLNSPGVFSQSEIVDFTIWLLFKKNVSNRRVQHLLCQGYERNPRRYDEHQASGIPHLLSSYPNNHVTVMKSKPWPQILLLMGKEGERAMIDLILDCGIFLEVTGANGVYHQLCGTPLGDLQILPEVTPKPVSKQESVSRNTPISISFVRNRILYARAALNAHGSVRFGLRHVRKSFPNTQDLSRFGYLLPNMSRSDLADVLNRYPLSPHDGTEKAESPLTMPERSTVQVMMYLFPRQFGLHNVFTSEVDSQKTAQPFVDYTLREEEISTRYASSERPKIPKRLRGKAACLTRKLQILHSRCSYKQLLDYYCPVGARNMHFPIASSNTQPNNETSKFKTQLSVGTVCMDTSISKSNPVVARTPSMMDYATPEPMVSAFCRAVLSKLIPKEFWGSGDTQVHNEKVFLRNVNRFIGLRRFESFTLHEPPQCTGNISQTDLNKRWEILHEFLYYLFDSILIPLIRTNFYVTDSGTHKYRLFYFRQDVWRSLAEPHLASLKLTMFEEVKLAQARRLLDSRGLGFSQIRLLPKEKGVRPIMNLRSRTIKKGSRSMLGPSINTVLAPVHNIFTYEKAADPTRLGSTLFSVGDLYSKLKAFKSRLASKTFPPRLYFAKLDVQAAFDTIPQSAVLALMHSLPSDTEYLIAKHLETKPGDDYRLNPRAKPSRKFPALAAPLDEFESFNPALAAEGRKNMIFVPNIKPNQYRTEDLLDLLDKHVENNLVKIGKRFFRQKEGIPQGSVVSTLLCNYFYADLEAKHLSFLHHDGGGDQAGESLLMRLIDDFLLVTTDREHARKFLQVMHDGVPAYGVKVNADKTLVNFEAQINGKKVRRLVGGSGAGFPYCGTFIDMRTLDVSKDREKKKDVVIADSLTVEFSKVPGKTFHRKVLNTFKIQAHAMFLDTAFNRLPTVLKNIHSAFTETATKLWTYARCLPAGKQPSTNLLMRTITDTMHLAFVLMKSKARNAKNAGYRCRVTKPMLEFLALHAFHSVLSRRQSKYGKIITWLDARIRAFKTTQSQQHGARMNAIVSL